MAIVWIVLLAKAFADPCQRLLPWSDSPKALKKFITRPTWCPSPVFRKATHKTSWNSPRSSHVVL